MTNLKFNLKDISIMYTNIYICKYNFIKKEKYLNFIIDYHHSLRKKNLIVTSIVTKMVDLDTSYKCMVEMIKFLIVILCTKHNYFFWHQAWQNFTTKKTLIWNIKNKK
jgi:hypothetical protein